MKQTCYKKQLTRIKENTMSNENDPPIPDEDGTQSLNQMVADIKSLKASVAVLETKVDAQSKHTNANLLEAFAKMLEQAKLDFAEIVKQEIAQAKEEIKAEITKEIKDFVSQEVSSFRTEVQQEFRQMKLQLRNMDRQFHQALKYASDASFKADDLEDRVERIEAKLPNQ